MGFIPGITNDIFISYSHHDDGAGWVTRFHDELATQMEELLGPVSIWRDIRLQANEDFPESIQTALSDTGVVLAIVSPNFLRSKYCCEQEIPHFEKNIGSAGLKVGNLYRVIKAIRRPSLEDRHELWLPDALGVPFWKSDKQSGSVQEFRAGTKPFKDSVARVAQAVAQTLIDLRNAHLPVYIAKPSTDLDKSFEGLRKELHARGYRVLPGDRIWTEKAVSVEVARAALSVHMLGAQFDPFVSRQAELARDREIPMLLWLSTDARQVYSELVNKLENYSGIRALVEKTPEFKLPNVIEQYVRSKSERMSVPTDEKCRVFILCESRQDREWQFATELRDEISRISGCEVEVPDPSAGNVWQDREQKLRRADGVLVYWDTTDERWVTYAHEDVRDMALRRKRDFRSEAIVVGGHRHLPVEAPLVFERSDPFDIHQLQPFFDQLRIGPGKAVSA